MLNRIFVSFRADLPQRLRCCLDRDVPPNGGLEIFNVEMINSWMKPGTLTRVADAIAK